MGEGGTEGEGGDAADPIFFLFGFWELRLTQSQAVKNSDDFFA